MMKTSYTVIALLTISAPALAGDIIPPALGGKTYVQHQIMQEKANHPEIEAIVVTGVRDSGEGPVIIGSTKDQASVFRKADIGAGPKNRPTSADLDPFLVHVAFNSRTDRPIGMIEIRFRHQSGADKAKRLAIARSVQADLSRATYSAKNAIDPYPFEASVPANTYAQDITQRITAKHPEIVVMMIHAKPPAGERNIVIGSNVGRIGKVADEDDRKVAEEGTSNLGLNSDGDQYETEVPLEDAQKRRIGALGLVFAYREGDNKDALYARGIAIRDEVARLISDEAQLFSPAK